MASALAMFSYRLGRTRIFMPFMVGQQKGKAQTLLNEGSVPVPKLAFFDTGKGYNRW
jgi:hypothetical protein